MDHFEAGRARVMIGGENYRTVHDGNWSVERRLRDMKAQSVDVEVISPMPELCAYWFTAADALDFCRYTNDVIVRMCAAAPGRFIGLGIVPLQDPEMAAKELAHVKRLGLPGVEPDADRRVTCDSIKPDSSSHGLTRISSNAHFRGEKC